KTAADPETRTAITPPPRPSPSPPLPPSHHLPKLSAVPPSSAARSGLTALPGLPPASRSGHFSLPVDSQILVLPPRNACRNRATLRVCVPTRHVPASGTGGFGAPQIYFRRAAAA